jgi:hypothetical protein
VAPVPALGDLVTPLGRIRFEPPLRVPHILIPPEGPRLEVTRPPHAELWAFFAGLLSGLALAFAFAMQVSGS